MDFDMYIGQRSLTYNKDIKICINHHLYDYLYGNIDMNKISYDYIEDYDCNAWHIVPNNDYTTYIFYTEQKILLRKLKLQKLLNNGIY